MQTRGSESEYAGTKRLIGWCVVGILAAVVAAVLVAQRTGTERLQEDVANERAKLEREGKALGNGSRKSSEPVVSVAELERLRGDRAALERLRGEIATLRKSVAETRPLAARRPKQTDGALPDITQELVKADSWRNLGYSTPEAAVETALWAAAGGDTDLLTKSIVLSDGARRKATELLAGLSVEMRARYRSPDEWVAFMAAKDVPLEGARILPVKEQDGGMRSATVQLRNAAGSVRQVHIELHDTPDGWRLVVPESAVERYAMQLKGRGR